VNGRILMKRFEFARKSLAASILAGIVAVPAAAADRSDAPTIENWAAPPYWTPARAQTGRAVGEPVSAEAAATASTPLPFVPLTPCRLADTRGNGFTGAYGPPALSAGVPRDFTLTGQCGIPASAQAVSLNVTVADTAGPGFIAAYPAGTPQPLVSTLNFSAGEVIANAAVVPLGTGGAITVVAGVSATDLILDVNGYYGGSLVTSLNGLSGDVALAAGPNVTITPSGQTLTIAATAGPGGSLPAGSAGQTLRHDGTSWVANGVLSNDGATVGINGGLAINGTVNFGTGPLVMRSSFPFIHTHGGSNCTYLGLGAGNLTNNGASNTAMGTLALQNVTNGLDNTAFGDSGLGSLTSGSFNTVVGSNAGLHIGTTSNNTGVGTSALQQTTGDSNTALGSDAGVELTTGSSNIMIGAGAGFAVSTGSSNIYIGSPGFNNESNTIRIGDGTHQTSAIIVGIAGEVAPGGVPVLISGGGRLGTTTSSIRFKEDVRDIGDDSDRLMALRPVEFRYKPELDPTGLTQYGLIAEEVARVYPDLVANGRDGKPEAIRYHLLNALLLNELQKQRRELDSQTEALAREREARAREREEIESLKGRLDAIERARRAGGASATTD
jgi:hypothetical protein